MANWSSSAGTFEKAVKSRVMLPLSVAVLAVLSRSSTVAGVLGVGPNFFLAGAGRGSKTLLSEKEKRGPTQRLPESVRQTVADPWLAPMKFGPAGAEAGGQSQQVAHGRCIDWVEHLIRGRTRPRRTPAARPGPATPSAKR